MKLNAQQLRELEEKRARGVIREIKRNPIYFILEDIYDTYNIGGLFRLADALAIEKMYLVGETETPPNSRIKKASIGTYKIVPWEYKKTVKEAVDDLNSKFEYRNSKQYQNSNDQNSKRFEHLNFENSNLFRASDFGFRISVIAVEQHPKSVPYTKANYQFPLVLIFGNESYGIKEETLKLADQIVEIPMYGINRSLNVIVAAGIVSYHIINQLR